MLTRRADAGIRMHVTISSDGGTIRIDDRIERRHCELRAGTALDLEPAAADRFDFPVDTAVSVRAEELTLPQVVAAYVRNRDGEVVAEAEHFSRHDLPDGEYSVELCAPIKLYLHVSGSLTVDADASRMRFGFGPERVLVGARSLHEHPAATITTTEDPHEVTTAVSYLGSALKTTTCERSYPTLRGHPPTIELGDEFDVPASIERPGTGVRIELPPEYRYVFAAAPLAYYLGAEVVPGSAPLIVTDRGFEHPLSGPQGFEAEIERVLKQTFFLDCLTRTEGLYPVELHERREVERRVDLEFADLYGRPLAEQLEAYLAVPFALLEDHLPEWKLTTHVAPSPENVELLPFLVDDLAVIRSPQASEMSRSELQSKSVDEFVRDGMVRSASVDAADAPSLVQPEEADSLEQAWAGESAALGASKVTVDAFRNKLERTAADGDIDITVVCNDAEMVEEHDVASEVYGSRDELPFDVTLHRELAVEQLRLVLESDIDFLHYIGHIDDEGFECADGKFDAAALDDVGIDAFLLNACHSYEQGMRLLEAGAIGGVVTLDDVINSGAIRVGGTMARLLNRGFPLRSALNVASERSVVGSQYLVVGDGNVDIAHAESGVPELVCIDTDGESFEVTIRTYPTHHRDIGSMFIPYIKQNEKHYLSSGELDTFEVTKSELEEFLALETVPVLLDGEFTWSEEVSLDG